MIMGTYFEMFKLQDLRKPSHMMTDVPFWSHQFAVLANVNQEHCRMLQKVIDDQKQYLKLLDERGLKGKDEKRFYHGVTSLNGILAKQLEKLIINVEKYTIAEQNLKSFKDNPLTVIEEVDQEYRVLRDKLEEQSMTVDMHKQKYHKLGFCIEKAEIDMKLADGQKVLLEARKKLDDLQTKAEAQVNKYNKHLEKWRSLFEKAKSLSSSYELAFKSRESARAIAVLNTLQSVSDTTAARKYTKRVPRFSMIDERAFVQAKLIETERIQIPSFEVYVGEIGKNDMYELARSELEAKENTNPNKLKEAVESGHVSYYMTATFAANKKLSRLSQTKVYVVTQEYQSQHVNQLNLKPGDKVRQILPAKENGFAYGQILGGSFQKNVKGFYQISHVRELQKGLKRQTRVPTSELDGKTDHAGLCNTGTNVESPVLQKHAFWATDVNGSFQVNDTRLLAKGMF